MKSFRIPFRGLKIGVHHFDWEIDKKFFEVYENPDIINCSFVINLELEKQERMMNLTFNISGELTTECDRCLEELVLPVNLHELFIIKIGQERLEEADDVLIIPESDYQIDIGNLVFDYITLAIPIKKVHGESDNGKSKCDPKVLKILENYESKEKVDPRWDALKNINLENNN